MPTHDAHNTHAHPTQLDIEALDGAVFRVDEAAAAHPERPGALGSLELAAESAAGVFAGCCDCDCGCWWC